MSCPAFDTYSLSSSEVRTARTSPGRLWSGASPSSGESASYRGLRFSPRVNSSGHPARGFSYHLLRRFAVARGAQELKFARRSRRLLTIHLGGVYHCGPILLGMVPNAQTHLEVADLYEKLSADENASLQTRLAFARKANWHRILARMSAEKEPPVAKEKASDGEQALGSETLFSPSRLWEARDKTELAQAEANAFRRTQPVPRARS